MEQVDDLLMAQISHLGVAPLLGIVAVIGHGLPSCCSSHSNHSDNMLPTQYPQMMNITAQIPLSIGDNSPNSLMRKIQYQIRKSSPPQIRNCIMACPSIRNTLPALAGSGLLCIACRMDCLC